MCRSRIANRMRSNKHLRKRRTKTKSNKASRKRKMIMMSRFNKKT